MHLKTVNSEGWKVCFFYSSKVFSYWSLYNSSTVVFGLLQYYIAALDLLNIAAMFCLSNFSKHFYRYSNLLLNTKYLDFSVVCNFCMLGFACALVCLCVYTVFMLCTA